MPNRSSGGGWQTRQPRRPASFASSSVMRSSPQLIHRQSARSASPSAGERKAFHFPCLCRPNENRALSASSISWALIVVLNGSGSANGCRELGAPHQKGIDAARTAPALGNGPHHERLTALHVPGGEHARYARHPLLVAPDRAALRHPDGQLLEHGVAFGAEKAHRQ